MISTGDDSVLVSPALDLPGYRALTEWHHASRYSPGANPYVSVAAVDASYSINADSGIPIGQPGENAGIVFDAFPDASATSLSFSLQLWRDPSTTANNELYMGWSQDGYLTSTSQYVVATTTPTTYSLTLPLTPGGGHYYAAELYDYGYHVLAGPVHVTSVGGGGVYAGAWRHFQMEKLLQSSSFVLPFALGPVHGVNARALLVTDETQLAVTCLDQAGVGQMGGVGYSLIAHFEDGTPDFVDVFIPSPPAATTGKYQHQHTLPSGHKFVEIVAQGGVWSWADNGFFLESIDVAVTPGLPPTTMVGEPTSMTSNRLLIIGDSQTNNDGTTGGPHHGWTHLLRSHWPGSVAVFASAGADLTQYWSDPTEQARLLAMVDSNAPSVILDVLTEHNTYARSATSQTTASPADYGTIKGQYLDALHAHWPSARIITQSSLPDLTVESWDGVGSKLNAYNAYLSDYKAAGKAACDARTWCQWADGHGIFSPTDPDWPSKGAHPIDAAQAREVPFYAALLGVPLPRAHQTKRGENHVRHRANPDRIPRRQHAQRDRIRTVPLVLGECRSHGHRLPQRRRELSAHRCRHRGHRGGERQGARWRRQRRHPDLWRDWAPDRSAARRSHPAHFRRRDHRRHQRDQRALRIADAARRCVMGPPQEARQQRVVSLREERSESHPSELSDIAEAFVNERRESNERSAIVADAVLSISAALGTITRDVREVALRQEAADLKMDRVERSMAVLAEKIDLLIAEFDEARGSLAAELGHRATNERHALKDVEQTQKDLMAVKEEFDDTRGSVAAELGHRATNEKHMLEDVETTKTDLKAVKEELGGLRAIVANPRVQGGLFTAGLGVFGLVIKLAIDAWLGSKGIK